MRIFRLLGLFLLMIVFVGCGEISSPTAPSGVTREEPDVPSPSVPPTHPVNGVWSRFGSYAVVHAHGGTVAAQNAALRKLYASGNLRGIRIGIGSGGATPGLVSSFVSGTGVEILGIIGSRDLLSDNLEATLARIYSSYPMVSYFQIGNEFDNPNINDGLKIEAAQYMDILRRVYSYTINNRPDINLVVGATMTGSNGAQMLREMLNHGLDKVDPNCRASSSDTNQCKLILSMNIYNIGEASHYVSVLSDLSGFRVWVTESGVKDPSKHIKFVEEGFPQIASLTRAERIYWYAVWAGDGAPSDTDYNFGLIVNAIGSSGNFTGRELFQALTGGI